MKKFTIEEIKNYILSQDSLGDVLYFLSEKNIEKANEKEGLKVYNEDGTIFMVIEGNNLTDSVIKQHIYDEMCNCGAEVEEDDIYLDLDTLLEQYQLSIYD